MKIDQLSSANTFEEWLISTSSLIAVANNLTDNTNGGFLANSSIFIEGSEASLNVRTHANINLLRANTGNLANTSLARSNATIQLDLNVGRNLVSNQVYSGNVYAYGIIVNPNAAFNQANSQFTQTNAAFIHANSGFIQTNSAFIHANSGFIRTNSAFIHANSGFNHANVVFIRANSGFNQSNIVFDYSISQYTQTDAAYIHANSQFEQSKLVFNHANSGFNQANIAFVRSNASYVQANSLFNYTNVVYASVNVFSVRANAAFIRANNSLNANSGGLITGNVTVSSVNGIKIQQGASYDSIVIKDRPGGANSYRASIVPSQLSGNQTITIPDETFDIGFRNVPPAEEKTTGYTLTRNDVGKFTRLNLEVGSGTSIIIPNLTFSEGDVITLYNTTTGNVALAFLIALAYPAGINTDIGVAQIPTRGVASIFFVDSSTCVCSGIIGYS